jgi:hypothetical protein
LKGWTYEDGQLRLQVPPFEVHQMIVVTGGQ